MDLSTVYERLHNLTQSRIVKSDIARTLDVDPAQLRRKEVAKTDLKLDELKLIANAFNLPVKSLINPEYNNESTVFQTKKIDEMLNPTVTLDYFPDVCGSCGNGVFQFSIKKEQITVPQNAFFKKFSPVKKYFVINAYGNSMEPIFYDKDKLIVQQYEGEQIIDNKPYLFCYKDEIFIKKLAKNVDQLIIIPENKDYDVRKLEGKQLEDVNIIGLVVGLMRDLR